MTRSERGLAPFVALGSLLVALLWPVGAQASASDEAGARALFAEGRKLVDEGNYAEACPKLAESQKLDPGGGTILNLGICLRQQGRNAEAWETYLAANETAFAEQAEEVLPGLF